MGRDKAMLELEGVTLIERIVQRLKPLFAETLISARQPDAYPFLKLRVVADRVSGQGPLMAIASALAASANDLNFVVSCDNPSLSIDLIETLLRAATKGDAAVPVRSDGSYEPLFAVYRKSMGIAADAALARGDRKVIAMYQKRTIISVRLRSDAEIKNINTIDDYYEYRARRERDG